jgi:Fe-S oxidoreductase
MPSVLEPLRDDLRHCAACHDQCLFATGEVFARGSQTYATSRKALLLLRVLNGDLGWTAEAVDVVYTALDSGIQHEVCVYRGDPRGWPDETKYIRAARQEITRVGAEPGWVRALRDAWRRTGDPYGVGDVESRPGPVVLVADAATRQFDPDWAADWQRLTERLRIEAGWVASGSAGFELHDLGYAENALAAGRALHRRLMDSGAQLIVCDAPETVWTMTHLWPSWGLPLGARVLNTSVWLDQVLPAATEQGELPEGPAAYHDPSALARAQQIVDEPRSVLARVGVTLVEFVRHGLEALPVGSYYGPVVGSWVQQLAIERRESAVALGAHRIIVASPFDLRDLSGGGLIVTGLMHEVSHRVAE